MAFKKAVVATDVPGTREVMEDNGFLVGPNRAEDLAQRLQELIQNVPLWMTAQGEAWRS